jgi:4-carboxymuconolactone decarboxylase
MPDSPRSPRIGPLPVEERDTQVHELLADVGVEDTLASNIFTTLVRHPGLFRKWVPFSGKLLAGKLPFRDRELLILRTSWHCGSDYEWGQHSLVGQKNGFTDLDFERIKEGPDAAGWSTFESNLLRAVDDLHHNSCISDSVWRVLAAQYDERQLIEVPMIVGHYFLLAFALNSFGVQREPGVPGFQE